MTENTTQAECYFNSWLRIPEEMFYRSCFVLFVVLVVVGRSDALHLFFPERVTFDQALGRCRSFGMTLLEVYSQGELTVWLSVRLQLLALLSLNHTETWLGLEHDGSEYGNPKNYKWLDTGTVTFLSWEGNEPNELPEDACVRIATNKFRTTRCSWERCHTVCQELSGKKTNMTAFQRISYKNIAQLPHHVLRRVPMTSPGMWLLGASPDTSAHFPACILFCHTLRDCATRINLHDSCQLKSAVDLVPIHNP
ncbi:uncharacterized protein LOC143290269 [Babylonia areolata]|uniref:uncharacterized protein LOC143290269 n=1 Tax=Babylonia areolata TaxID=304850 RepID=UPI003FD4E02F